MFLLISFSSSSEAGAQTCTSWLKGFTGLGDSCVMLEVRPDKQIIMVFDSPDKTFATIGAGGVLEQIKPGLADFFAVDAKVFNDTIFLIHHNPATGESKLTMFDLNGNLLLSVDPEIKKPIELVVGVNSVYISGYTADQKPRIERYNHQLVQAWIRTPSLSNDIILSGLAIGDQDKVYFSWDTPASAGSANHYSYIKSVTVAGSVKTVGTIPNFKISGLQIIDHYAYVAGIDEAYHYLQLRRLDLTIGRNAGGMVRETLRNQTVLQQPASSQAALFYDQHRHQYSVLSHDENHFAIWTGNGNDSASLLNLPGRLAGCAGGKAEQMAGDNENMFLFGRVGSGIVMDYVELLPEQGTHFLACLTTDYAMLPQAPIYAAPDTAIGCGSYAQIDCFISFSNPYYYSQWQNYLIDWEKPGFENLSSFVIQPAHDTVCRLNLTSGQCTVTDSVRVNVFKETNFRYTLTGNQLSLERTGTFSCNDFVWDFGDGGVNMVNPAPVYTYPSNGTFTVCLKCIGQFPDCMSCLELTVPGNSSGSTLEPNAIDELAVSPVHLATNPPVGRILQLVPSLSGHGRQVRLYITNLSGQVVFESPGELPCDAAVNLQHLSAGFYLLDLTIDGRHFITKLILN